MDCWEDSMSNKYWQTHEYLRSLQTDNDKLKEFDIISEPKIAELMKEAKKKRDMSIILKYKLVRMKESIDAQRIIDEITKKEKGKKEET